MSYKKYKEKKKINAMVRLIRISPSDLRKELKRKALIKRTIAALQSIAIVGTPALIFSNIPDIIYTNLPDKQIFAYTKVMHDLKYYGGDSRYMLRYFNTLNFSKNKLVAHVDVKKGEPVKIYLDDNLLTNQRAACEASIEYLNELFDVINSNYQFKISSSPSGSQITVGRTKYEQNSILAQTKFKLNFLHSSKIDYAHINFNTYWDKYKLSFTDYKVIFMHEMMHSLIGMRDLNYYDSQTYSIMNYDDGSDLMGYLNYKVTINKNTEREQLYNNFDCLMPIDLSALMAVYGNTKNEKNKRECTMLLSDTLESCKLVLGDDIQYFDEGYTLPTVGYTNNSYKSSELTF